MPQNPFEVLREIGKRKVETDKKRNEFIYSNVDSLITWLVGFSFTALCLIASNISTLKTNLKDARKPIIIFYFITVVIGLAVRYLSYLIMLFYKDLEDHYLSGVYGDWDMSPIALDESLENIDYSSIVNLLKDDFNETIPFPRELTVLEQQIELPKLVEHYKALCDHSRKQFDLGVRHLAEIYETAYKIDKQKTINQFNKVLNKPNIGYNMPKLEKWRGWLYLVCILSFIVAVLISLIFLLIY